MRFRFCGDADCPDWLLLQINSLSNLTPLHLEELSEIVVQPLLGKEMDLIEVDSEPSGGTVCQRELSNDYGKLRELSKAASLETSVTKACVSAVHQVLKSGSCYAVKPNDLGQELEQLGLDRQHSEAIIKVYSSERNKIMDRLQDEMLRAGRMNTVSASQAEDSCITLHLSHTDDADTEKEHHVLLTNEQAHLLLGELKNLQTRMEELVNAT